MRTMAGVWFSVLVLISMQKVFGNVCQKDINEFTCDECVRCGGDWCRERKSPHCVFSSEDDWCPNEREFIHEVDVSKPGVAVEPIYAERTLYIGNPSRLDIKYNTPKQAQMVNKTIIHSTQTFNIELKEHQSFCNGKTCTTTIEATAFKDFCHVNGGVTEYVDVKINVGLDEEITIKYHIPCACNCSSIVERNSQFCNNNGDLSCGACTCHPGWTGEFCEKHKEEDHKCDTKRGDIVQCSINPRNDDDCSGNGYCGVCETCICYTDREGSQYFDPERNCADLCMITSECEDCLINGTLGSCYNCDHIMTLERYNKSLINEKDDLNRKMWVSCNETIDGCGLIQYYAMKNEDDEIHVMITKSCIDAEVAGIVGTPKVPIIMGVLGVIAAVAAIAGVMMWKHMNAIPPVPLTDPQYQNIDAEDCIGENPLYKPPTSMYKNPTYGKC